MRPGDGAQVLHSKPEVWDFVSYQTTGVVHLSKLTTQPRGMQGTKNRSLNKPETLAELDKQTKHQGLPAGCHRKPWAEPPGRPPLQAATFSFCSFVKHTFSRSPPLAACCSVALNVVAPNKDQVAAQEAAGHGVCATLGVS